MMKRFKKYRPYSLFKINEKQYALVQVGIASFVLIDSDGSLLNNGINADETNYLTHKELVKLAETDDIKFEGYLEYSPVINEIQSKFFKMLRKEDDVSKLKDELKWALTEMRNLGVTNEQEERYAIAETMAKGK